MHIPENWIQSHINVRAKIKIKTYTTNTHTKMNSNIYIYMTIHTYMYKHPIIQVKFGQNTKRNLIGALWWCHPLYPIKTPCKQCLINSKHYLIFTLGRRLHSLQISYPNSRVRQETNQGKDQIFSPSPFLKSGSNKTTKPTKESLQT